MRNTGIGPASRGWLWSSRRRKPYRGMSRRRWERTSTRRSSSDLRRQLGRARLIVERGQRHRLLHRPPDMTARQRGMEEAVETRDEYRPRLGLDAVRQLVANRQRRLQEMHGNDILLLATVEESVHRRPHEGGLVLDPPILQSHRVVVEAAVAAGEAGHLKQTLGPEL